MRNFLLPFQLTPDSMILAVQMKLPHVMMLAYMNFEYNLVESFLGVMLCFDPQIPGWKVGRIVLKPSSWRT